MTAEETVRLILARAMEFTDSFPTTRTLLWRRIEQRQQYLFAVASYANPDFFGVCAIAPVADGMVSLTSMSPPVDQAQRLTRIEIKDPGETSYAVGLRVNVVDIDDADSMMDAPRVTVRGHVIRDVAGELEGVESIEVYYSRRPGPIEGPDTEIQVPDPFGELLVIDGARELVKKTLSMAPESRTAAVALLDAEEQPLFEAWLEHVRTYASDLKQDRFGGR